MEELVEKAKDGDKSAFTELILSLQNDLYSIAKIRVKDIEQINDILQETMLAAYVNLSKLKENKYFKTWIIKILINKCNKSFMHKKIISIEESDIERYIGTNEIQNSDYKFEDIISFLNKEEKTILTLYYYLGYTTKEISRILNKNEGTISSKISRAKQKIRKRYEGEIE